ncbi:glycosyltransferase family 4 protein [Lysinibacillus sp. SGAir0095]|uniref:glycosyltransferase family 4 protein n=1 Tax=Lysinibacillus sp. SGAir0095 TaxID=2070463 RepID=UPI0010CCD3FB|nr:glycosyltransferase family 4 protein [Lysinibacillus sp. SGAir0095]QCR31979.1 glycosyltransferase WbuB [Lysinibacillus sp. SGAir0095]
MKKKIWIFNHYATGMYIDQDGRHFNFAKNLLELGHEPIIFCASTSHNSYEEIELGEEKFKTDQAENIPFVFVKTPRYTGNGVQRVKNMLAFYRNLFPVAKEYAKNHGKPACIIASSVHPLTLIAGIKIAKELGVPCLCEIRDLWPESLVTYGIINRSNLLTKVMYLGEKWIYKKADKLIFTMEGGKDYIVERGWDLENGGPIDLTKVHHINNGVDLGKFLYSIEHYNLNDEDISNSHYFKVVYTGSIRKANNVRKIVEIARIIQEKGVNNIQFLIFGDGPDKEILEKYCLEKGIDNIKFKGFVGKKYIPYILSKSNLNIVQLFDQNDLKRFGASLNKMFDYFASGTPTISDCLFGYDLIKKYNCGVVLDKATVDQLADAIIEISKMPKPQYEEYCNNARIAAHDYDFKVLTKKLENLL